MLFGQQSGMQVSTHGDLVRGLSSPGVTGTMSREEALSRILTGTGLTFQQTGADTVTLAKLDTGESTATMLGPVTVYGARTTQTLEDVDLERRHRDRRDHRGAQGHQHSGIVPAAGQCAGFGLQ